MLPLTHHHTIVEPFDFWLDKNGYIDMCNTPELFDTCYQIYKIQFQLDEDED